MLSILNMTEMQDLWYFISSILKLPNISFSRSNMKIFAWHAWFVTVRRWNVWHVYMYFNDNSWMYVRASQMGINPIRREVAPVRPALFTGRKSRTNPNKPEEEDRGSLVRHLRFRKRRRFIYRNFRCGRGTWRNHACFRVRELHVRG